MWPKNQVSVEQMAPVESDDMGYFFCGIYCGKKEIPHALLQKNRVLTEETKPWNK